MLTLRARVLHCSPSSETSALARVQVLLLLLLLLVLLLRRFAAMAILTVTVIALANSLCCNYSSEFLICLVYSLDMDDLLFSSLLQVEFYSPPHCDRV